MFNLLRLADILQTTFALIQKSWNESWFFAGLGLAYDFVRYAWVLEGIQNLGFAWRMEDDIIDKMYALGSLRLAINNAKEVAKLL